MFDILKRVLIHVHSDFSYATFVRREALTFDVYIRSMLVIIFGHKLNYKI